MKHLFYILFFLSSLTASAECSSYSATASGGAGSVTYVDCDGFTRTLVVPEENGITFCASAITATSNAATGLQGPCGGDGTPPATLVSITITGFNINEGSIATYTASGNYSDGSTINLTSVVGWSSTEGAWTGATLSVVSNATVGDTRPVTVRATYEGVQYTANFQIIDATPVPAARTLQPQTLGTKSTLIINPGFMRVDSSFTPKRDTTKPFNTALPDFAIKLDGTAWVWNVAAQKWVQSGGGSSYTPSITTFSASQTLTSSYETWGFTGASAASATLPSSGSRFVIYSRGTGILTVAGTLFTTSAKTSILLYPGDAYTFQWDGAYWKVF